MRWTELAVPLEVIVVINCECVIHRINLHRVLVKRLSKVYCAFLKHIYFLTLGLTLFKSRFFLDNLGGSVKRFNSVLSKRFEFRIVNQVIFY